MENNLNNDRLREFSQDMADLRQQLDRLREDVERLQTIVRQQNDALKSAFDELSYLGSKA